jgi:hypothetical protein
MAKNEIREYLTSLIPSAQEGSHIVPPPGAAQKIADEVERRTKARVQNLAGRDAQTIERIVTAHPAHFVDETLRAIDDIVVSLEAGHAREFEVEFANRSADPDWDFGKAKLAVRYIK